MKRLAGAVALALAVTAAARGHFVFILPGEGRAVHVVFSDELKPDGDLAKKVAHTKFAVKTADGKVTPVRAKKGKQTLDIEVPGKGPALVLGVTSYGVVDRGKTPFLLTYYSKSVVGVDPKSPVPAAFLGKPDA